MGKDLFFYSISVKPQDDTPAALKHYAKMRNADLPGWYFLTGDPYDIETIRFRLFNMGHIGVDPDFAMHSGTFRIINDATNYWGHAQAFASQKNILKRISWADPFKSPAEWDAIIRARRLGSTRSSRNTATTPRRTLVCGTDRQVKPLCCTWLKNHHGGTKKRGDSDSETVSNWVKYIMKFTARQSRYWL